jgi:hypothetical protein
MQMTVTILIPGDVQCANESGVSGQASLTVPRVWRVANVRVYLVTIF